MRFFRKLMLLVRREKFNSELEEEMAFHRSLTEEELRDDGMDAEEARHAARRRFGNDLRLKEQSHEVAGFWFEGILQDLRFAVRQLRHNPTFAAITICLLALGIGVSTAMFTALKGVLLQKPAFAHIDRLVAMAEPRGPVEMFWGVSLPDVRDWRAQSHSFEQIAYSQEGSASLERNADTRSVTALSVSSNFFSTLGVRPMLGRSFVDGDEQNKAKLVVLNYALWREVFGANPAIVGQAIKLDGDSYQVVGIMPKGFSYPLQEEQVIWKPYAATADDENRGLGGLSVLGRLRPGVKLQQAQAEMNGIEARLAHAYPGKSIPDHVSLRHYWDTIVGNVRPAMFALTAAVAMVWLVACINIAGLMLTRNATRQREIAIRGALGAGKMRLVRQLLTENLLLSLIAGLIGLGFAWLVIHGLQRMLEKSLDIPRAIDLRIDVPVVMTVLGLSILSTLIFGLLPAVRASRTPVQRGLQAKAGERTQKQSRLRDVLVVSEITLSLLLLTGAGLLLRTMYALRHVPLGFTTENVLTSALKMPRGRFDKTNVNTALYQPLIERIEQIPGVQSAAVTSVVPLQSRFMMVGMFDIVGQKEVDPNQKPQGDMRFSSPEYPQTMGIRIERGRFFNASLDTPTSQPVVVVNHTFVEKYLHGQDPLSKQLSMGKSGPWSAVQIIGVIADVHEKAVASPPGAEIHLSTTQLQPGGHFYQLGASFAQIAIRTRRSPAVLIPVIHKAVHEVDSNVSLLGLNTMSQIVEDSIGSQILAARLISIFAAATLLIAVSGLYGLIHYSVSQRTREIGVRMALGAQRRDVVLLVLRRALVLLLAGLCIGNILALASSRVLRSFLFGVHEHDAVTFAAVSLLLGLCGIAAACMPAQKAASVDPVEALRSE